MGIDADTTPFGLAGEGADWARATFPGSSAIPVASSTARRAPRCLFTHYLHVVWSALTAGPFFYRVES